MIPVPPAAAAPFDRATRRRQRARATGHADFLHAAIVDELAARVAAQDRDFAVALALDAAPAAAPAGVVVTLDAAFAALGGFPNGVVGDADRLPFADASFDLIASAASLHAVNDLPGALIRARQALRPGGLFVAGLVGGTSLIELRRDLLDAEVALTARAAARVIPMVDPDAAAGLLQRAGFRDPVAEVDTLAVRYDDLFALLTDLRAMGEGNFMVSRAPLRRDVLADAARRFAERAVGGRIAVTVQVIYLTGWG